MVSCYHNWRYSPKKNYWYCANAGAGCTTRAKRLSVVREGNPLKQNGDIDVTITSHRGTIDLNHKETVDRVLDVIGGKAKKDESTTKSTTDDDSVCANTFADVDDR